MGNLKAIQNLKIQREENQQVQNMAGFDSASPVLYIIYML